MSESLILVPIRYPPKEASLRTLRRAIELHDTHEDTHLYILHVNPLHKGEHVERDDLVQAVEREFGTLSNTSYHVRDAFLFEEAILYEAIQQDADFVVIGTDRKARWRRVLAERLDLDVDLAAFLRKHLDAELVVV